MAYNFRGHIRCRLVSTTILDRLMHRATLLEFEGKGHRRKEATARIARGTSND